MADTGATMQRYLSFTVSSMLLIAAAAVGAQPTRAIIPISDALYRAQNGNWYGILLVTEEGIILGDPINTPFAEWLKDQLDERFDVPVRYVVYSHSHFDHAQGGAVFADTATFVGHENMLRNMDGRFPQMPGDMVDRNNNGRFDFEEIEIPTTTRPGICGWGRSFFDIFDANGDGQVTPQELQREIVPPDITFSERMTLELGGRRVELIHPGKNHADDAVVMLFPEERVLFATEFLADALVTDNVRSLPSACGPFDGSPLADWILSYRTVEALDFDRVAPGHGLLFEKAAVTETREFFEDLVAAVSAGMARGASVEELRETIELPAYRHWEHYERLLPDNVEAAYDNLRIYR
jgi:glyoxylase-like metal-dependent hydrolase (beta-lactamase superfamily II)